MFHAASKLLSIALSLSFTVASFLPTVTTAPPTTKLKPRLNCPASGHMSSDRNIKNGKHWLIREEEVEIVFNEDISDTLNIQFFMPLQSVDATHALKRSAGVSKSNVSLGRSFN